MDTNQVGLIILSLFCLGGVWAYVRETLRLQRLMTDGTSAEARVVRKKKIDTGSESVVNYMVTYEFNDERGAPTRHEEDLNSATFFDSIHEGDVIPILYLPSPRPSSYPASQVRRDRALSIGITAAIIVFWIGMATVFVVI